MKTKSFLFILYVLLIGITFSCGNDDNTADFDNETQGKPQDVANLRKAMNGEFEFNNNDSIEEGGNLQDFKKPGYGCDENGNLLWKDYVPRTDYMASVNGDVLTGKIKAIARVKSCFKEFDGKKCFAISRFSSDFVWTEMEPWKKQYEDLGDTEDEVYYGAIPDNATFKNFKYGEKVKFRIKRIVDLTWLFVMPNLYYAEIELAD